MTPNRAVPKIGEEGGGTRLAIDDAMHMRLPQTPTKEGEANQ
jgi:hypothetical protein